MSERPPFDATRAAFFLVVGVIAVQCVVVLSGVAFCWINPQPDRCTDLRSQLAETLAAALAAALAFAGGFNRKDK